MDEKELIKTRIARTRELLIEVEKVWGLIPEEKPPETPTPPPLDAKRLDRIWKYLQGYMPPDIYGEFNLWAVKTFDYKYYGGTGRRPIDLRTAVCDKLRTFTESQIAELEEILEAKE